jgi:hypothetical protein
MNHTLMNHTSRRRPLQACVAGLAAIAVLGLPGVPAAASGGDREVERRGACSGSAHWKLKVKNDDGRLEVEGEVDSNRVGQRWRWRIIHNGSVTARGVRETAGRSGSFSVERKVVNLRGTDNIVFRASHGGQTCRGVVNF